MSSAQPSRKETPEETKLRFNLPLSLLESHGLFITSGARGIVPPSPSATTAAGLVGASPSSLPYQLTRANVLSVSGAIEANIPVIGGGSLSALNQVIVLERVGYDEIATGNGGIEQVGFAIRLCVTVKKLDANIKLTLPFVAASAQLGSTEAACVLQIVGLGGPKIAGVKIVPTELNVESFVVAKQNLDALVDALIDPTTTLDAKVIARQGPPTTVEARYAPTVYQAAALGALSRGWSMQDAASRFHWDLSELPAPFAGTFQDVAKITSIIERPGKEAVGLAARILDRVNVNPR